MQIKYFHAALVSCKSELQVNLFSLTYATKLALYQNWKQKTHRIPGLTFKVSAIDGLSTFPVTWKQGTTIKI